MQNIQRHCTEVTLQSHDLCNGLFQLAVCLNAVKYEIEYGG